MTLGLGSLFAQRNGHVFWNGPAESTSRQSLDSRFQGEMKLDRLVTIQAVAHAMHQNKKPLRVSAMYANPPVLELVSSSLQVLCDLNPLSFLIPRPLTPCTLFHIRLSQWQAPSFVALVLFPNTRYPTKAPMVTAIITHPL